MIVRSVFTKNGVVGYSNIKNNTMTTEPKDKTMGQIEREEDEFYGPSTEDMEREERRM